MTPRAMPAARITASLLAPLLLLCGLVVSFLRCADAQLPMYGSFSIHDPSTMIKEGNTYHVFGDGQGISTLYSTDLRNWTAGSAVFSTPPAWTTATVPSFTGNFWAPDIAYANGQYYLYYAASTWDSIESAIGLATSPTLDSTSSNYRWTDQGKVIGSSASIGSPYNCIDPAVLLDNGTMWLVFGSYFNGIYIAQLDPTTGKCLNTTTTQVSNNGASYSTNTEEGASVYKYNGYYYLFVNCGECCSGVNSTYNIRVGRSASVTGPYLDRSGVSMLSGGGTPFLESTGRFIGPGHAGILNDNGTYWFTYHYYNGNGSGVAKLGINQLQWGVDGWPTVTTDWSAFYTYDVDAREHMAQYNGTLASGASIVSEPGRGNVLNLDGVSNYATIPLSAVNARTFSAWVKWSGGSDVQHIFDFGASTAAYLYLTPRDVNGKLRFAITNNGSASEQYMEASSALPTNTWCHVAVTLDGSNGILYLNGNPVAASSSMTILPWTLLARNNYIGKSQSVADPYFSGKIDSLRIFGRALSRSEISDVAHLHPALAHRYSFSGNVRDSMGMAHGGLNGNATIQNNAVSLTGAPGGYVNLPGGLVSGASAVTIESWVTLLGNTDWAHLFDFGDISGVAGRNFLFFSPTAVSKARVSLSTPQRTSNFDSPGSLDNQTVHVVCIVDPANSYSAVYANGVLRNESSITLPALSGVRTNWGFLGRSLSSADPYLNANIDEFRIYDGRLTAQEIAASYAAGPDVNGSNNLPAVYLPFDETSGGTATDATANGWDGTLMNNAAWASGKLNNGVSLNGISDYVTLPAGVVNGFNDFTIAAWVKLNSANTWQRIFDFGTGTDGYMYLTPQNGVNGTVRFAIRFGASGSDQTIDGAAAVPVGVWTHVAVTLSGNVGTLYVNGSAVGTNPGMTLSPLCLGNTNLNYIGKSQFGDPYFSGMIDEFRIYGRALSVAEITSLAVAPSAPTGLAATVSSGQVTLHWSGLANATSYALRRGTLSGQETTTISRAITGLSFTDTGLVNGTRYYYVVTASNAAGLSPDSSEVNAEPAPTYAEWISTVFPGVTDPMVIGNNADPDHDGIANLAEYFMGTNPASSDAAPVAFALDGQGNVVLTFHMAKNLTGVTYSIDQSFDLLNWTSTGLQGVATDMGSYSLMKVTVPKGTAKQLFLRISLTPDRN